MSRPPRIRLVLLRFLIAVLAILIAGSSGAADRASTLRVTALGNEGFLIEAGDRVVIVDGLYRGLRGYPAPTEEQRVARERAMPPFDSIDLVLATHHHPDHFDAEVVARYLTANPGAVLIATPTAVDLIGTEAQGGEWPAVRLHAVDPQEGESVDLDVEGVEIEVLNLHHGRDREPRVANLGFIVRVGGISFLHMGDAEATADEISTLNLRGRNIDLAFVPYWYLLDSRPARSSLEAIGAKKVVAMHLPSENAPPSYLDPASSLPELIELIEDAAPGVVVPRKVMETLVFRLGDP